MEDKHTPDKQKVNPAEDFPGADINGADDGHVDPELVKQRTCMQNNNPRNNK